MVRKLNTFVHAVERDERGNTTRSATFGPDDDVPGWGQEAITNPDVWDDGEDDGDARSTNTAPAGPTDTPGAASTGGSDAEPSRPKGNASREDWAAYAAARGVEVTGEMGRGEIKAAVDRQAPPAEPPS